MYESHNMKKHVKLGNSVKFHNNKLRISLQNGKHSKNLKIRDKCMDIVQSVVSYFVKLTGVIDNWY